MILNTLVCVFLLGMVVLWATYGFFSSFLNLLVTLTSVLLAFALWEPVSHWMLGMGWVSAWGFGLLLPYLIVFIALRLGMLAVARKNMGFHPVVDQVGGGAMGLAAGILTSGVLVIGAGMMANDKDLLGVQHYRLNEDGSVSEDQSGGSLWLPVDRLTGNLAEALSAGSFQPSGNRNLASAFPKLAEGVEKRRLAVDPMATRTAAPGKGVQVVGAYEMECTPEALEWMMRRSAAYAVMKQEAVDDIWKGEDRKQVELRLADRVAEAVAKGDLDKALFDGKYLGNAERMGVRGLLGRGLGEAPESILRRMWSYAEDQIPGGSSSAKGDDKAVEPVQKMFTKIDAGKKLVVIDTSWDKEKSKAYDDGVLRLSPHQILLAAAPGKAAAGVRYQPLAWSTGMLATPSGYARRELLELSGGKVGIYGTLSQPGVTDRLAFVFAVPKGVEIEAIELRGLRFPLAKGMIKVASPTNPMGAELAQVIGHLLPPGNPEAKPTDLAPGKTAPEEAPLVVKAPLGVLDFTARLPMVIDWTNPDEQNAKYVQDKRDVMLVSGEFEREVGKSMGTTIFKLTRLKVEPGNRCARLMFSRDQCQTLWGAMLDSAERGGHELVLRTDGRQIGAAGFVLARVNGVSVVRIDPNGKYKVMGKALADLRPQMGDGDRLYAYYFVDESESVVGYGLYDAVSKAANDKQQYLLETPVSMKRLPIPR